MESYNANYWESYDSYIYKKKSEAARKEKRKATKKERKLKIKKNNSTMSGVAKQFAKDMKAEPSALEKRMQAFLDSQNVQYDFQRVFKIKDRQGRIIKFYIADFYIPAKNLIIETDGAFHDNQIKEDIVRTKTIQKHYPNIKVIRWRWHDFDSYVKMEDLASRVK